MTPCSTEQGGDRASSGQLRLVLQLVALSVALGVLSGLASAITVLSWRWV